MQNADDYGLIAQQISADIDAVVKRSRGVAKQLSQGVAFLMKKHKITVHMGEGKLASPGKLTVTSDGKTETLTAKRSEAHTSELQSLMRTSYADFCWKKNTRIQIN